MSRHIEYKGFVIESATRLKGNPRTWTLAVHITPAGRRTGVRRCRARNTYPNETVAELRCLEFGRQIVDGKLHPRDGRAG